MGVEQGPKHRYSIRAATTTDYRPECSFNTSFISPDILPKSPLTGLPDVDRFPHTLGYPAIWGASGRGDESQPDASDEDFPESRLSVEDWRTITQGWTGFWKKAALIARSKTYEQRREIGGALFERRVSWSSEQQEFADFDDLLATINALPDGVLDKMIRSFPEFEGADDEVINAELEALRKRREESANSGK